MVNIAVLGYGTVGSGVVEIINTNRDIVNNKAGQEICVKYVLDLRDFPGDPVEKVLVHDYNVILKSEVEIVVEVMGGVSLHTLRKSALETARAFVHQIKSWLQSMVLSFKDGTQQKLLFEASVGGSIPISDH